MHACRSTLEDPTQPQQDPNDPNVRTYPGGGAEDLLGYTKRLDDEADDSIREGDPQQNAGNQRLRNQPDPLSAPNRGTTPLNSSR